jgi:hypothetical protein
VNFCRKIRRNPVKTARTAVKIFLSIHFPPFGFYKKQHTDLSLHYGFAFLPQKEKAPRSFQILGGLDGRTLSSME